MSTPTEDAHSSHHEVHKFHRSNWLRAAVLGANDGIISTASLLVGVISAGTPPGYVLTTGIAALAAGAASMAAGEYVSVSAQADAEHSDLAAEARELKRNPDYETQELADIYRQRGLNEALANSVAEQLMAHDALGAHARDEIGIDLDNRAQPLQAAWVSAAAFSVGAVVPVVVAAWSGHALAVAAISIVLLACLGALGAQLGGGNILRAIRRIAFWGCGAMAVTHIIGRLVGANLG